MKFKFFDVNTSKYEISLALAAFWVFDFFRIWELDQNFRIWFGEGFLCEDNIVPKLDLYNIMPARN